MTLTMTHILSTSPENKTSTLNGALITLGAFIIAIFVSAYLLFAIQPLFTKMALPLLGGSPNVWNTALVFFQGVLLLGYLYAHCITKFLNLKVQIIVHIAVILGGIAFLPIGLNLDAVSNVQGANSFWLLALMAVSIGWPFFALSANAPLLQRWFSLSSHKTADDPYFLYAASNAGSILSLLLYPFFIEPNIGLTQQSELWAHGYTLLIALIACAGITIVAWPRQQSIANLSASDSERREQQEKLSWLSRGLWVLLAAIPSGLMLAVTTYLTTDVAAAPFLWILPLTLYLVSFVIVFSPIADSVHQFLKRIAPLGILLGATLAPIMRSAAFEAWLLHLLVFFLITTALHGGLARRRPSTSRLTEFYLLMSLGGVIGGIFTAIIAPAFFPDVWEYPILMILSAGVMSYLFFGHGNTAFINSSKATAIAASLCVIGLVAVFGIATTDNIIVLVVGAVAISLIAYTAKELPIAFAVAIAALIFAGPSLRNISKSEKYETITRERSFFGVVSVKKTDHKLGQKHVFFHGTTIHNLQYRDPELREKPVAYFGPGGSYDQLFSATRKVHSTMNVGVVGLGAGALACFSKPGDTWQFYEIDPLVVDIALNDELFSFVSDCAPDAPIKLGDGRIKLEEEIAAGDPLYDLLILDAFSSDSVPAHLLTTDAINVYRKRIPEDGIIFMHTSNKYLDVTSVALASAKELGLATKVIRFNPTKQDLEDGLVVGTIGVLISTQEKIDRMSAGFPEWIEATPNPIVKPWTDETSNIMNAMIAHKRGGHVEAKTGD